MRRGNFSRRFDSFMDRHLSGTVFTWRQILQMTIPYMLDNFSIMLIGMLITALISSNGVTSMAAVSLVGPITNLVVCVFNGIGAGGTVVVAQCCGMGDPRKVSRACGQVISLTVLIGVVACLPLLLFPNAVLMALYPDAEEAVLEKASVYLAGSTWSILAFTLYIGIYSVLRGLGESKKCLILSIIINVAYLLFSIVFLNWLKLDIRGSVYALVLARIMGAVCAVALLFIIHPPISLTPRHLLSFDRNLVGSTMKVSIPLGLEQIFSTCGSIVAGMFMIRLGTTAVATNAIANSLQGVLLAAASSSATLAVTVVGRCVGAGKRQEARRYTMTSVYIGGILLALSALVFFPLLPLLLRQYNPTPQQAATATRLLLLSIPALFLCWPMSNTMPNALRAANDTVFPSVFSLCALWVVNIALAYLLSIHLGMGLMGVWIALWATWTIRALGFYLRFRHLDWSNR